MENPCQPQEKPRAMAEQPDGTARSRAMIYYALAEALADPLAGVQEMLLQAVTLGAQTMASVACQKASLTLAELPGAGLETLRRSYMHLIAGRGQRPLILYESLHRQGGLPGPVTWQVERYYRTLGLAPVAGELPDHASMELACLGHLAAAEAEACKVGDDRLVARSRTEQRIFLRTHPGDWLPEVGMVLAAAADHRFYAVVGGLLSGFLTEEMIGRKRNGQTTLGLPTLKDPEACTLCGLCVGSCPLGALRVIESNTETTLTLSPGQCTGCNRCGRICPEEVLFLGNGPANGGPTKRVMHQSVRLSCPNCGRPTVSQAELDGVFARLQPDPAIQQRLCLCVECKASNV